jgi:hypothetical protein
LNANKAEVIDLSAMADNEYEIFVGEAKDLAMGARTDPEQAFQNINRW